MKFDPEEIYRNENKTGYVTSARTKVFNGWLVINTICIYETGVSTSTEFVLDKNHEWQIDKE